MPSSRDRQPAAPTPGKKWDYWCTEDGLLRIRGWARDGLTDEQLAKQMEINPCTLYRWFKRHPEIKKAIAEGKDIPDRKVEDALLKRALGFEYDEVKTVIKVNNGRETKDGEITKIHKTVIPDVAACAIWLKNRKPEVWRQCDTRQTAGADGVEDLKPLADLLRDDAPAAAPEPPAGGTSDGQ